MTQVTLFGVPAEHPNAERPKHLPAKWKGAYIAQPGTGPENETCWTCQHYVRKTHNGRAYLKCFLMRNVWTHGHGSDIRAKSPACNKWEKDDAGKKKKD